MDENEILTAEEAAEKLKLSYRVVLDLIREGKLPAAMVKGKWRLQARDVLAMLDQMKAPQGRGKR